MARPRLGVAVKAARGTLRPSRERSSRVQPASASWPAPERDYVAAAREYADDVLSGRIVACGWVQKAARRFLRFLERASDPTCPSTFSAEHANDVCAFVERCPHCEGRWNSDTIRLEPWQAFILTACYGSRDRVIGDRLVTMIFFQVARKSAKSTIVAVMALYHLAKEPELIPNTLLHPANDRKLVLLFFEKLLALYDAVTSG